MAAEIPTIEPTQFAAGDTVKWTKSLSDYPASGGWVLSYAFVNADGTFSESTSTADGDSHAVVITAADSADFDAGTYNWQSYVTLSGERFKVGAGTCVVLPNFAAGAVDGRSHVKRVLDAIQSVIQGRATEDADSLSLAGRSISKIPLTELVAFRDAYKREYAAEQKVERIAAGMGHAGKVRVRFP
jgi:hypothetical protein